MLNALIFVTAMKPHEIQEKLGLTRIRDRNWYVQPSCATTGDGLYEGLTWLTSNHKSWCDLGKKYKLDIKDDNCNWCIMDVLDLRDAASNLGVLCLYYGYCTLYKLFYSVTYKKAMFKNIYRVISHIHALRQWEWLL